MILLFLEQSLEAECDRVDPRSLKSRVAEIREGAKPRGYWSEGPISESVLDRAVQTCILKADERACLHRLIGYTRNLLLPGFVTTSVIGELENGVNLIERIYSSRCNKRGEVTHKPLVSRPSAEIQAPLPCRQ
jgi:hypothetical protein